jgi:sugar phosphate isomerase/epimerase
MSFSIDSWAFGNTPIEQTFARVSSAGYTGIDLSAPAHLRRRAPPPAKQCKMMAGARGLKPWQWNLDLIAAGVDAAKSAISKDEVVLGFNETLRELLRRIGLS